LDDHFNTSALTSRSAKLTDFTLSSLTINTSSKDYTIPLDPPLQSWSEARTRLVAMDVSSRTKLQRAPVTVTKYLPPSAGFPIVVFVTCFVTYIMLSTPSFVEPNGWAYELLLKWVPGLPEFTQAWRLWILIPMIGIHLTEAGLMVRWLRWANVRVGSGVWFAWVGSCFIEGFDTFRR
jgi:hypothetical protein